MQSRILERARLSFDPADQQAPFQNRYHRVHDPDGVGLAHHLSSFDAFLQNLKKPRFPCPQAFKREPPQLRVTIIRVDGSVHERTPALQWRRSRYEAIHQVPKLVDRVGNMVCIAGAGLEDKRQ